MEPGAERTDNAGHEQTMLVPVLVPVPPGTAVKEPVQVHVCETPLTLAPEMAWQVATAIQLTGDPTSPWLTNPDGQIQEVPAVLRI